MKRLGIYLILTAILILMIRAHWKHPHDSTAPDAGKSLPSTNSDQPVDPFAGKPADTPADTPPSAPTPDQPADANTTLSHDEINSAMMVYLGGDSNSGSVTTKGMTERLQQAYPDNWQDVKQELEQYLRAMFRYQVDWKKYNTPVLQARYVEQRLTDDFPWLDPMVRKKMASYFTYAMK